ncbi:MAG: hypothetical protein DRR08_30380 [Candidatus Parabeggiatoa sp. nov. 2]|nr:MAG: hypothetical protein B6247_31785 [Beggiatoa sp. 4572_84]RKZ50356.1 MAG: hypothetical protein DRR08_30380 [Gammaproteobacteria bacterium]
MKKIAAAVSLACAGLTMSPATWAAGFSGAGVDNVKSLAQFKITFTKKFAVYLRDNKNAPFCKGYKVENCPASAREFTSQMLYEPNTKVGRSGPHRDGDMVDEQLGADICKDGNTTSCKGFFSWTDEPILDAHFQWKDKGYHNDKSPFDEGPTGREEIHTQVVSFEIKPLKGGPSKNAVRAGAKAPCQARSLGEVESLNGDGFPAESFFQMYVDVDVDFDNNGSVDMVFFNQAGVGNTILGGDPLIIEATGLKNFPPKVIYQHTGRTADKVAPKLYLGQTNRARSGEEPKNCDMASDPNNERYDGANQHVGWIRIATHGIGFGKLNTRASTRDGATPDQCRVGEDDIACFTRNFKSLPMAPIPEKEDGPFPTTPRLVELDSVMALAAGGNVALGWTTASEIGNAGFHIWRARKAADGEQVEYTLPNGIALTDVKKPLTEALIPTQGVSHNGVTYSYEDTSVTSGTYYYAIVDIDFNGKVTPHLDRIKSVTVD